MDSQFRLEFKPSKSRQFSSLSWKGRPTAFPLWPTITRKQWLHSWETRQSFPRRCPLHTLVKGYRTDIRYVPLYQICKRGFDLSDKLINSVHIGNGSNNRFQKSLFVNLLPYQKNPIERKERQIKWNQTVGPFITTVHTKPRKNSWISPRSGMNWAGTTSPASFGGRIRTFGEKTRITSPWLSFT